MKLVTGKYFTPDMFPSSFTFPGSYKLKKGEESSEAFLVSLQPRRGEELDFLLTNERKEICLWIEEESFLIVRGNCEIVPFVPEE